MPLNVASEINKIVSKQDAAMENNGEGDFKMDERVSRYIYKPTESENYLKRSDQKPNRRSKSRNSNKNVKVQEKSYRCC